VISASIERPSELVNEVANLREGLLAEFHRGQVGALRTPHSALKSFKDRGREIGPAQQPAQRINVRNEGVIARQRGGRPKRRVMRFSDRFDPGEATARALMFIRMMEEGCHVTTMVLNHLVGSIPIPARCRSCKSAPAASTRPVKLVRFCRVRSG
jgi:hypothetical protein